MYELVSGRMTASATKSSGSTALPYTIRYANVFYIILIECSPPILCKDDRLTTVMDAPLWHKFWEAVISQTDANERKQDFPTSYKT